MPRLLRVRLDELGDALDERVRQPLVDVFLAPLELVDLLAGGAARRLLLLLLLGELEQPLDVLAVLRLVEHHLLDVIAHRLLDILVDGHPACVDDAHCHAVLDGVVQEDSVDRLAQRGKAAETEREVGDAARDLGARQLVDDPLARHDEILAVVVVFGQPRCDGEDVGVEDDVPRREAHPLADEKVVRALADALLVLVGGGLALLVEGHDDDRGAVPLHDLGLLDEILLALFERDGIDDTLALAALEARLDDVELGRIDHDGQLGDVRLGDEHVEELIHRVLAVKQTLVHIDVDHLRTALGFRARDLERLVVIAVEDELLVLCRPSNIAALAHVHEAEILVDGEGLEARNAHLGARRRPDARLIPLLLNQSVNSSNVLRRGAAAAAERVDEVVLEEELDRLGERLGRLVVAAHRVGQASIRVRVDEALGNPGERLHEREHLVSAERAIEADADGLRVLHRDVESLRRLPGEGPARHVHDRPRDHHWQPRAARLLVVLVDGEERRFRIERVENGLDEHNVASAVDHPLDLRLVRRDHLVPRAIAEAGVFDRGRDGQRAIGRAYGASDQTRTVRLHRRHLFGGVDRQLARDLVQFVDHVLHAIVGLRDDRSREGVRLAEVGARHEVAPVDLADGIGLCEDEKVVVAFELLRGRHIGELVAAEILLGKPVLLDRRAHGTVDDHDPFGHVLLDVGADHLGILHARDVPGQQRPVANHLLRLERHRLRLRGLALRRRVSSGFVSFGGQRRLGKRKPLG
mmetsp:Transcript_24963/g.58171  ORF Transcript_24963/g.58171 Transcript_24963/m.58171 type:complete len:753 (-) Transcript_24963:165-2423(-)